MKVRLILPAVAFLFAVAGALANVTTKDVASIPAYPNASPCTQNGTCTENTALDQCETSSGVLLYKINGSVCNVILKGSRD